MHELIDASTAPGKVEERAQQVGDLRCVSRGRAKKYRFSDRFDAAGKPSRTALCLSELSLHAPCRFSRCSEYSDANAPGSARLGQDGYFVSVS